LILFIIIIAVVVSLAWHGFVSNFWLAVVGSSFTALIIFYSIAKSHFGWMEATFFKNVFFTLLLSAAWSAVAGVFIRKLIRANNEAKAK
jgi:hypothetical protein